MSEDASTLKQLEKLLKDLQFVLDWEDWLSPQKFDWSTETHPGGWKLGISDVMVEEVLILYEIQTLLGEEAWTRMKDQILTIGKSTESTIVQQTKITSIGI